MQVGIKLNMAENLRDIRFSFTNFKAVQGLKSNLLLSVFIVIIIIGLWSIWY